MKKILFFAGALVLAVAVFVTTKNVSASQNTDLESLSTINSANAECKQQFDMRDTGNCSELTENCYWGTVQGRQPCDPWAF